MRSLEHPRPLGPSFSERHHVTGTLLTLVVLIGVAAVVGGAVAAVIVRIVGLMVGMVGGS